jgi:DCN1-like protein 1/2
LLISFYTFFSCDSIEKLKGKLPSLEKEICDNNKFKEFYQFTFNYAKNPGQKGLDLEMAMAYWNIVLSGRFRLLDIWTKFLKVNITFPNVNSCSNS